MHRLNSNIVRSPHGRVGTSAWEAIRLPARMLRPETNRLAGSHLYHLRPRKGCHWRRSDLPGAHGDEHQDYADPVIASRELCSNQEARLLTSAPPD